MIVERLLTMESKRRVKETYNNNVIFRTIDAAYKEQEIQMTTLRFSTEEIWVNCFLGFDQILRNHDNIDDITCRMWNNTFIELRDEAQESSRRFEKEELETATSCIIYSIIACMMASDDWKIIKHTETLMFQIEEHSNIDSIIRPFNNSIEGHFVEYVQEYISKGKYISDILKISKNYADPIPPINTPYKRKKAKDGIKKRLEFMNSYLPESEKLIMTRADFYTMIESIEYLIENNVIKKIDHKLHTNLKIPHLRYTFYLVFKNEGKCIDRQLWLDFLCETFLQMRNNKASLSHHFADKPTDYDKYFGLKKKK